MVVVLWQNVEKIQSNNYFCKALYVCEIVSNNFSSGHIFLPKSLKLSLSTKQYQSSRFETNIFLSTLLDELNWMLKTSGLWFIFLSCYSHLIMENVFHFAQKADLPKCTWLLRFLWNIIYVLHCCKTKHVSG